VTITSIQKLAFRQLRIQAGFRSARELADHLAIHPKTIAKWEREHASEFPPPVVIFYLKARLRLINLASPAPITQEETP
jgi:hypothetical protein